MRAGKRKRERDKESENVDRITKEKREEAGMLKAEKDKRRE